MGKLEQDFAAYRARMNERVLAEDNRVNQQVTLRMLKNFESPEIGLSFSGLSSMALEAMPSPICA